MKTFFLCIVGLVTALSVLLPEEISLIEERKQILRFGTESEILDLVQTLQNQRDSSLLEDLVQLLEDKVSVRIQRRIFDFLAELELTHPQAVETAIQRLKNLDELDQETILSHLRFLALPNIEPQVELVLPLLNDSRRRVVTAAVRYLGRKGGEAVVPAIIELFEKPDSDEDIHTSILLALGDLKSPAAVDFLISILDDPDERMVYRRFAADSLGKIGSPESLPFLKKALEDPDSLFRAYAVNALGFFPGAEVDRVLMQALRDDSPRVRAFAAESLGRRRSKAATEILIFRVRRDSDRQVRLSSLRSLAALGTDEALNYLQELLLDDRASLELRLETIRALIQNPSETGKEALKTLLEKEWAKENSRLLDELGRQLSILERSGYEEFYEKMLTHRSFIIRIYGIRGIRRNNLRGAQADIVRLAREGASPIERREARLVLELWGLPTE